MPGGYKPSPLGYGTPRSSPFRRPESPSSAATPTLRQSTPPATSPTKFGSVHTPSRLGNSEAPATASDSRRARGYAQGTEMSTQQLGSPAHISSRNQSSQPAGHGNALSKLQPAQVRVLRDGFQILDRDGDGVVNREDVADMLNQLGTSNH